MKAGLAVAWVMGLLVAPVAAADRVEESRTWTDTFTVNRTSPTLEIRNIWGDVNVRAGKAGEISVTISEHRSAPDQARFERSLEFLKLYTESSEGGVSMHVGDRERNWHWSKRCKGCRAEYRFDIVAPVDTQLDVATVNDGHVGVTGIAGVVNAGNVNGPVSVSGLSSCTALASVNGEVTASFVSPPVADCDIDTVNGDIIIQVPAKTGLNVAMDLFNGRMYSDLPVDPLAIPARVEESRSDGHYRYRIEQPAGVTIAGGGPTFSISSINGDIRIQKIQ